jgi:hypothetical protein
MMSSLRKRNKRKTLTSKKQKHTRKNGKRKQRRFQKQLHSKKYRGGKGEFDLNPPDLYDKRLKGIHSWLPLYKGYAQVKKSIFDGGLTFNRRQIMIVLAKVGKTATPAMFIIKCISDRKCSSSQTHEQQLATHTKFRNETVEQANDRQAKKETLDQKSKRLANLKIHQITVFKSNDDGSFQYRSKGETPTQTSSGTWTETELERIEEATYTIKLEQAPDKDIDDYPNSDPPNASQPVGYLVNNENLMNVNVATIRLKAIASICDKYGLDYAITKVFSDLDSYLLSKQYPPPMQFNDETGPLLETFFPSK